MVIKAEDALKAASILDGLTGLEDLHLDFYHDETNNYRKFHFKSGALNIENSGEFILGGIVVAPSRRIDISYLKKEMKLDKAIQEMKFKHIAKGDFVEILKSGKLNCFLKFIKSENINIHIRRVNSFYWGIVDIFDSIDVRDYTFLIEHHWLIKDFLYRALNADIKNTLYILSKYNYPDISSDAISDFYDSISYFVKNTEKTFPADDLARHLLLLSLSLGKKQNEAVFIQQSDRAVLVDDYSTFYRDCTLRFPNCHHNFDIELEVKKSIEEYPSYYKGNPLLNYSFIDSKLCDEIQLSDVVVGLMSKMINFCNKHDFNYLQEIRDEMGATEIDNLCIIEELISRSDNKCRGFFHSTVPTHLHSHYYYGILTSS